jgi:hypothetical protein
MNKNRARNGAQIDRIRALMADGKPRTSTQVCDELDISLSASIQYFRHASHPGEYQEVHSIDNKGENGAARFVWGKGKNKAVQRPPNRSKPIEDMTDDELNRKFKRTDFRSWPKADLLVIQSINNMVRSGVTACSQ